MRPRAAQPSVFRGIGRCCAPRPSGRASPPRRLYRIPPRAACLFTFGIELILPIRDTGIAYFSDIDLALFDNG
ncbi:hypothetical protein BURPS406E_K0283 [Burkholderia pseudomallei 406e]|nr:hypothetical protein BURPS406E_K0283 [Burkholderia pseudomallei 406e]EDO94984.1 hypothetical protein BURPSPAST_AB0149 [Burkholderia pseudomallei Pasteur 52237]EDS84283.1 hypothetical protein BURPSS13_A0149 [Burkholderia pseudomallei S13]